MTAASVREILVLVECDASGKPTSSSLATVTFARRISQIKPATIALCLFQGPTDLSTSRLLRLGATTVLKCQSDVASCPIAEQAASTLAQLVIDRNASCLLAAANSTGKDWLPRVAALLDCAFVGDSCNVSEYDGTIAFHRPVYAGNATASCVARGERTVVTVRHSEFTPAEPSDTPTSNIESFALAPPTAAARRVRRLGFYAVQSSRPPLTDARVIVTGGRALGHRFTEVLGPLADSLDAAIGATRAACDAGYAPSDFQVGQTGKIVAPDLYVAVGVSGAVQHVAGIRSSRVVVAINSDPEAPIFSIADYGLVGDLFEQVPKLVSAIRRVKGARGG
jgi:electron transfer flavoprotein alpha subunit